MFKKSFLILKNNMIFIQPILILQIIFTSVLLFSMNRIQPVIPKMILLISMLLLFSACLAGWLYINKYAILSYNEKDTQEEITVKTIQNFKKFFEGIGTDFIRTLLACTVTGAIYFGTFYGLYRFCISHFGIPQFIQTIADMAQNGTKEQLMQYLNSITETDKLIFAKWVITINTAVSVVNLFALLYFAVMSFERKNFIISLFLAVKFFVLNLFEAIGIMLFVFFIYLILNALSAVFASNALMFALIIILITLYLNYYVLLVFCFYYDKTKNNSNNRPELIGEDTFSRSAGEDN